MTEFKTVSLEDGEFSVVKVETDRPRHLEVVAIFYRKEDADNFAEAQDLWSSYTAGPKRNGAAVAHKIEVDDKPLTEKQQAILATLKKNPKGCMARDIAEMTEVSRTSAYVILKALKTKGKISEDANGIYQAL